MIPWALKNWGKVIVGILILSITVYIGVLKFQIGSLRGENAELRGEVELWKQTYSVLSQKVAEQNAAINKLEEQTKTARKKRAQADEKAAPIVAHQKQAETRLEAIAPSTGACEDELSKIQQLLDASR
jgi:DNA repair exonuclease SbcCD ATPase subunit